MNNIQYGVYRGYLNIWADSSGQTVSTQIRPLLKEWSDLGVHYLLFYPYLLQVTKWTSIDFRVSIIIG